MNWTDKYHDAVITNIRYGKRDHQNNIYAEIREPDGSLLVAATLDYCVERMKVVAEAIKLDNI